MIFAKQIEIHFTATVEGDGSKHHGTVGKYYGLGTIAKYSISDDGSSYGEVSHTKSHTSCSLYERQKIQGAIFKDLETFTKQLNDVIKGIVGAGQCIGISLSRLSKEVYHSSIMEQVVNI